MYERVRPGYPAEAVRWLVPPDARVVVDVGAGTGKFTRQLTAPGRRLIAVEPSRRMLEQLRSAQPSVDARLGPAERLPVADGSVDAVTFAQSWHWTEHAAASREAGRVLRPGGVLGLVWNLRDERVDWVRRFGRAMHADGDGYAGGLEAPDVRAPFGAPERAEFPWASSLSRDQVLDLVRSKSYFILMPPARQKATLAAVNRLVDTHPALAGREAFELPYVTVAYRYRVVGSGSAID